jgi:hypothetical protein
MEKEEKLSKFHPAFLLYISLLFAPLCPTLRFPLLDLTFCSICLLQISSAACVGERKLRAPWTKPQDGNMFKTRRKTTDNVCPSNLTVELCFTTLACRGSAHVDSYKDGNEPSRSRKGETFVE